MQNENPSVCRYAEIEPVSFPSMSGHPVSVPDPEIIDSSFKVDEEQLIHYKPGRFYPVNIGDIFESRYQVLSKLGYGSCCTAWLSRDITFAIPLLRVFLY